MPSAKTIPIGGPGILAALLFSAGCALSLGQDAPAFRTRPGVVATPIEDVTPRVPEVDLPRVSPLRQIPNLPILPTAIPPKIDGKLDDACWTKGPVSSDFRQVDPFE